MKAADLIRNKKKLEWRNWFVYLVLLVLLVIFSLLSDKFLHINNLITIGRQTAMTSMIAFGATFVITTGNIDLSVGSIVGLVGVTAAAAMQAGLGIVPASLIGIATGVVIGLIRGC